MVAPVQPARKRELLGPKVVEPAAPGEEIVVEREVEGRRVRERNIARKARDFAGGRVDRRQGARHQQGR